MSEPDSLYVRVPIEREALERWLDQPPAAASGFTDWVAMHPQWEASFAQDFGPPSWPTNRAFLAAIGRQASEDDGLAGAGADIPGDADAAFSIARWRHDEASGEFLLVWVSFSENLIEFAETLAVFRGLAGFRGPGAPGWAYVFSGLWTATASALARIDAGASRLLPAQDRPQALHDAASEAVEAVCAAVDAALRRHDPPAQIRTAPA